MFDDFWSRRIDIICPNCHQPFKVRLRKLHFGSELVCRLCRYEFEASRHSELPEVQNALAHMRRILAQRTELLKRRNDNRATVLRDAEAVRSTGARTGAPSKPLNDGLT